MPKADGVRRLESGPGVGWCIRIRAAYRSWQNMVIDVGIRQWEF